jgi:hypothetical protein
VKREKTSNISATSLIGKHLRLVIHFGYSDWTAPVKRWRLPPQELKLVS